MGVAIGVCLVITLLTFWQQSLNNNKTTGNQENGEDAKKEESLYWQMQTPEVKPDTSNMKVQKEQLAPVFDTIRTVVFDKVFALPEDKTNFLPDSARLVTINAFGRCSIDFYFPEQYEKQFAGVAFRVGQKNSFINSQAPFHYEITYNEAIKVKPITLRQIEKGEFPVIDLEKGGIFRVKKIKTDIVLRNTTEKSTNLDSLKNKEFLSRNLRKLNGKMFRSTEVLTKNYYLRFHLNNDGELISTGNIGSTGINCKVILSGNEISFPENGYNNAVGTLNIENDINLFGNLKVYITSERNMSVPFGLNMKLEK